VSEQQHKPLHSPYDPSLHLGKGRRDMAIHVALLIAVCLLVSWPVLIHGIPDLSDDALSHARWAKQFATQFWQGDWYPKWLTNVNGGFGGPTFFFYPPLASYVSALFWPFMAARDPDGWLVAGYAIVIGQILSGITAYLWLRSITKPGAALLGAVVYVIAPYHLAVDVYQRGASAELWVFVWFPLVLLSAEGLLRHSKMAIPGAAVSYGLAVLSHPTVSLCFAPIPVAYMFCFSERKERIRATAMTAAVLLLGVALNAEYLLPAMLDQDKAYVAWNTVGHGDYHNQWLWQDGHELAEMGRYLYGTVSGTEHQIYGETELKVPFLTVTLATLPAIAGLFPVVPWFEKAARLRRIALFYGVVAVLSLFFMTKFSSFIWQMAPFMKFLQFPFRLNVLLVLSVTALAAVAVPHLLQPRCRMIMLFLCVVVAGWLGLDVFSSTQAFTVWRTVTPDQTERTRQLVRAQIDGSPMWPKPANLTALEDLAAFDRFVATHPPKTAWLEALSNGQTNGTARVESWPPRRVVIKIEASRDSRLTLNHFYYVGWQGRIDDTGTILTVSPSPDGLIQLGVPKGDYDLIVELPKDRAERAGTVISLVSLALLGGAAIWAGLGANQAGYSSIIPS
jgi:hypothetical protein